MGCTDTGRADLEGPAAESGCKFAEKRSMVIGDDRVELQERDEYVLNPWFAR